MNHSLSLNINYFTCLSYETKSQQQNLSFTITVQAAVSIQRNDKRYYCEPTAKGEARSLATASGILTGKFHMDTLEVAQELHKSGTRIRI